MVIYYGENLNMKYYIYHIPNYVWVGRHKGKIGKIGVAKDIEVRFKNYKTQNLSDWKVLEEHTCKFKVSNREMELQKEYGYPIDSIPYWRMLEMSLKAGSIIVKTGHQTKITKIASKLRQRKILQYDKAGNFIREWNSMKEAGIGLDLHRQSISHCCRGKLKSTGGYIWKYKDENNSK